MTPASSLLGFAWISFDERADIENRHRIEFIRAHHLRHFLQGIDDAALISRRKRGEALSETIV